MILAFPAPTTRIADDQAANAEASLRELRELLAASRRAGADDITRFSCRVMIDEAIAHLTACRHTLA